MAHSMHFMKIAKFLRSQDFKTSFKKFKAYFYLSELVQKIQFAMTDPVQCYLTCIIENSKIIFHLAKFDNFKDEKMSDYKTVSVHY